MSEELAAQLVRMIREIQRKEEKARSAGKVESMEWWRKQEEEKEQKTFPLSDEGMDEAIAWLFERFETEKSKWLNASRDAMHIVNHQTF